MPAFIVNQCAESCIHSGFLNFNPQEKGCNESPTSFSVGDPLDWVLSVSFCAVKKPSVGSR